MIRDTTPTSVRARRGEVFEEDDVTRNNVTGVYTSRMEVEHETTEHENETASATAQNNDDKETEVRQTIDMQTKKIGNRRYPSDTAQLDFAPRFWNRNLHVIRLFATCCIS